MTDAHSVAQVNKSTGGRRPAALAVFLVLQAIAAFFYIGDVASDFIDGPRDWHVLFEALVTAALLAAIIFAGRELKVTLGRMRAQEAALAVAAGALAEVIQAQFQAWLLTAAERDVGLLALKGMDVAEIATLRGAAQGTVRAQLARIYTKSGVSGRAQFAALFVEDLLSGGVSEPARVG
jgi:DNA-binding CsgD family transcriptional regulator